LEFDLREDKQLSICAYDNGIGKEPEKTQDWTVNFKDRRHYLSINDNGLEYEVITINHVALVFLDKKNK
jgi:hypothetical protein